MRFSDWLVRVRQVSGIDQCDPRCDVETARTAHDHQTWTSAALHSIHQPLSDLDDFISVVLRWRVGADDRVSTPDDLRGFADTGKIVFLRADSGNALQCRRIARDRRNP